MSFPSWRSSWKLFFQNQVFLERDDSGKLTAHNGNGTYGFNIPINIPDSKEYLIKMVNLYNGVMQAVLQNEEPTESKTYLIFVDMREGKNFSRVIPIGRQHFSDILLRDSDSVIAVKLEKNNIFQSYISMNDSEPAWEIVPHNITKEFQDIVIQDDNIPRYIIQARYDDGLNPYKSYTTSLFKKQSCTSTNETLFYHPFDYIIIGVIVVLVVIILIFTKVHCCSKNHQYIQGTQRIN